MAISSTDELKLQVLADGMRISDSAQSFLDAASSSRSLTPADYASTSGLILRLDGRVWVNAPIASINANFVECANRNELDVDQTGQLVLRRDEVTSTVEFWPPPAYHGAIGSHGRPYNHFVFSHGDRARLAPIRGCAMVCKFCNIPYEDRYDTKPIDAMVEALTVALQDPVQPAHHILISGGTPKAQDHEFLQETYRRVLREFPSVPVDIMMVPVDGLLNVSELADLGLDQLSVNVEILSEDMARQLMRQKLQHGLDHYLRFIEMAASKLGEGRVRSMLMVGLEPAAQTLRGVRLILDAGGTPVLSPFRPDPGTPLSSLPPPSSGLMRSVLSAATEVASRSGQTLGPECPPCTHNTLTLLGSDPSYQHPAPRLV